jgi:predicted glycogen debranching enzyme
MLVNGLDAWIEGPTGRLELSSQRYHPGVTVPEATVRTLAFRRDPWPRWTYQLREGAELEHEIFVSRDPRAVVLSWRAKEGRLYVRPFLSGRDFHALHRANGAFRFEPEAADGRVVWNPYPGVPQVIAVSNGAYTHLPLWYRNFQYDLERDRGLDFMEDLAAPGLFSFDLGRGEAFLVFSSDPVSVDLERLRETEVKRRRLFSSPLHLAADQYIVAGRRGKTIIAGYPWFSDWGRDTFVALRGLCLSTGRLDDAREILLSWADQVKEGMLPNRFTDSPGGAEFNSVDASLWYVAAVKEYLRMARSSAREILALTGAIDSLLAGFAAGAHYGIKVDEEGLLAAGEPGLQLTWMDAKVGERVITPRIGKPVEVQALWLEALAGKEGRWRDLYDRGLASFRRRFWNEASGGLYDVVDQDHQTGRVDPLFRPNQILAWRLLEPDRARRMVDEVEARLVTPAGLRSLAPGEPGYQGRYQGGIAERDGAYHQGTVWPWLMGPFVEAWIGVRGSTAGVKSEARQKFVEPLLGRLEVAGLGHLFEIADGDPPHAPRGCPFQAWSLGELLRLLCVTS